MHKLVYQVTQGSLERLSSLWYTNECARSWEIPISCLFTCPTGTLDETEQRELPLKVLHSCFLSCIINTKFTKKFIQVTYSHLEYQEPCEFFFKICKPKLPVLDYGCVVRGYPVISYPWIFLTQTTCTQAQTLRTHFRSVQTQPSRRFVPNKLWHKMFKTNINIHFIYPGNRKIIKMHTRMRKIYLWSYLLHCWTLLNNISVSDPHKVSVICFSIVYTCEFLDNNS